MTSPSHPDTGTGYSPRSRATSHVRVLLGGSEGSTPAIHAAEQHGMESSSTPGCRSVSTGAGRPAPDGFRRVRVHDLKHTCGRRLRAAGVGFEDRQDILAHKSGRMTTHYSAAELGNLVAAVNRITNSHGSHTGTVNRAPFSRVMCKSLKVKMVEREGLEPAGDLLSPLRSGSRDDSPGKDDRCVGMASRRGQSSNRRAGIFPEEGARELLESLEQWSDYLELYRPSYRDTG
jgi:hypothetical protein